MLGGGSPNTFECFCEIHFITHILLQLHPHTQATTEAVGAVFLGSLCKWFNLPITTMLRHINLNTFAGNDGGGWDGGKSSVLFGQVPFPLCFHMCAAYHFPLLYTIKYKVKNTFLFFLVGIPLSPGLSFSYLRCMSSTSSFCTFRTSSSARVFYISICMLQTKLTVFPCMIF